MSCRSTPCGSAVSSVATALSGRSADEASVLLHALRAQHRSGLSGSPLADTQETVATLEAFSHRVRHDGNVSPTRRARVLAKLDLALDAVRSGSEAPEEATLRAWRDLPAALEAAGTPQGASAGTARNRTPYHKRFRHFNRRALEATDALFAARPSGMSPEERDVVFREWVNKISDIYGMEAFFPLGQ
jgi:hypothetical protein